MRTRSGGYGGRADAPRSPNGPAPGTFLSGVQALRLWTVGALVALAAGCLNDSRTTLGVVRVSPAEGSLAGGTTITVEGSGFDDATTVEFLFAGETPPATLVLPPPTLVSSRILLAVTPELPGTFSSNLADVVVRQGSRAAAKAQAFRYLSLPPTLSSVTPATGPTGGGTAITLSGSGFLNGVTVSLGGVPATGVVRVNPNTITCATPAGPGGAVTVTVHNPDLNTASLPGGFTYVGPPAPTAVTPTGGATVGGTRITITGAGFQTGATVTVAGAAATDVLVASGSIICATPALPGAASITLPSAQNIVVTNPDTQSGTLNAGFTYRATRLFVSHAGSPNTLMVLNYNENTGALAQAFGSPLSTGGNAGAALAATANANFPDGLVYVANRTSDSIDAYSVGSTGTLTAIGSTVSMNGGGAAVLRPSLLRIHSPSTGVVVLYALNDNGTVSTFGINTGTGALTEQSAGSPLTLAATAGTPSPSDWVISGAVMYVADPARDLIAALTISAAGQLAAAVGSPVSTGANTGPTVLHLFPGGQFLYAARTGSAGNALGGYQVSPSPPLVAVPGNPFTTGTLPLGMADDGTSLFVANAGSGTVTPFAVSTLNGSLVATTAVAAGTGPVALHVRAPHLYAINTGSNDVSGWSIGVGGALTAISGSSWAVTGAVAVVGWEWAADRVFVLDGAQVVTATRSSATGALTFGSGQSTGGSGAADLVLSR